MNANYGKPRICLVEKSANGLSVDPLPKTFLSFSYENYFFEVFRPLFSISAPEAIIESKHTNPNITIQKTELDAEIQDFFIKAIKN